MTAGPIVFIGDSITDAGRRDDPEGLGHGYVRMVAAELAARGDDRPVLNTGISGNRVRDVRARFVADAIAHRPALLTIYVGVNDTWRRYDRDDPTTAAAFEADYRAALEQARELPLILIEPFLVTVTAAQRNWDAEDLAEKRAVVARLAAEFGAGFVPLFALMTDAAAQQGAAAIARDGVHPTELGAQLIAGAWLDAEAGV